VHDPSILFSNMIQSRPIHRYTINRYEILNRYAFLVIFDLEILNGFLDIFCNDLWVSTVLHSKCFHVLPVPVTILELYHMSFLTSDTLLKLY